MKPPQIPATYWNGQSVHAPTTNKGGSWGRAFGLAVDHYLPGDYYADHILGLDRAIPGTSGNTALDETVTIGAWLLLLAWIAWVTLELYGDD